MQFESKVIIALIFDAVIAFAVSVTLPWKGLWAAARIITWAMIPLLVSYFAMGPENLSFSSSANEADGLFLMMFFYLCVIGLGPSTIGTMLGFILRWSLSSKT